MPRAPLSLPQSPIAPKTARIACAVAVAAISAFCAPAAFALDSRGLFNLNRLERAEISAGYGTQSEVRVTRITYRAFDGLLRDAYVVLPRRYRPGDDPPIPLVISPHGRGILPQANAALWGNLPAIGDFALVCPEGQGRRLALFAWGYAGDIADLARMPAIVERALPYVHIDHRRIYAVGSSMGGQETLLLIARDPHLLAGAAVFDAVTDLAERYRALASIPHGLGIRQKLVYEVGGTPAQVPGAYRRRSPLDDARAIAFSGVPLQMWWSTKDKVVRDQAAQSGLLYQRVRALNPAASIVDVVGTWAHSAEFKATRRLALSLSAFGLLPTAPSGTMSQLEKRALELPADWRGDAPALVSVSASRCVAARAGACDGSG